MVEQLSEEEVAALLAGRILVESDEPAMPDVTNRIAGLSEDTPPAAGADARRAVRRAATGPGRAPLATPAAAGQPARVRAPARRQGEVKANYSRFYDAREQPAGFVAVRAVLVLPELRLRAGPQSAACDA